MMGNSKCFVFGCKTGYASDIKRRKAEGKKNLSLFSPPQNEECFQKWKRSVPRSDKELSRADKVCELHFLPEEISRHYIHKMPDGSIKMLEKGKINLLTGAVPTVFPNLPAYRSKDIKKRKPPAKRQRVESVECNTVDDTVAQFPIHNLIESLCDVQKPNKYWSVSSHEDFVVCAKWDANFAPERQIIINADLGVKIMYYGTMVSTGLNLTGSTALSLSQLLAEVEKCQPCSGAKEGNKNCSVFIEREWGVCGRPQVWCSMCKIQKAKPKNPIKPKNPVLATKYKRLYQRIVSANRKNARLREKIALLKQQIELVRKECSLLEHKSILKSIAHLPEVQRCNIEACLNASKVKSLKGVRYTNRWVYECLLMRIKSRKLYEHLRENKILALPTIKTLGSYIKHIKGSYGFESKIFECLERKASFMDLSERRGVLLIDEMQLSPSLAFDKKTLEVNGFTNLGRYTPKHQASQKGDHALVLMYQPFKGKWIQSVAAFLSKGAASGSVLHHIVIEAVALLEKSGFYVDAITTDGASWNRKMWLEFGISEENVSCAHVCDPDRRLWFLSDFPHLIKNLRNFITEKKFILTPDGPVKTSFWDAIIEHDNPRSHSLKICPKLKPDHISPKFFQKMNVAMAFQFFSESVASGMEALKDTNAKLRDSEGCIVFVKRLNKLIDNMNSRTPYDALKLNSLAEQVLKSYSFSFE